jgi:hypothetical protein
MFELVPEGDQELCEGLVTDEVATRRAMALRLRRLVTLDSWGICERRFGKSTAHWYAGETGLSVATCRRLLRVGHRLRTHFGEVFHALEAGRVSFDHAEHLVRVANPRVRWQMADMQAELLDLADACGFERWAREVSSVARVLDEDGGFDPAHDTVSTAHATELLDGTHAVKAHLNQADGLAFKTELERLTEERFRYAKRCHDECEELAIPSRSQLAGAALVEMARRSAARDLSETAAPRVELLVLFDLATGVARTADGTPIKPATLSELCTDAVWRAMWLDRGRPLAMGRRCRYGTPSQRIAVAIRDGGCIFPDCDRPAAWCHLHHVEHWEDGGPTDVDNLAMLCGFHHRVTHSAGWEMTTDTDEDGEPTGWFTWTTPEGEQLHSQRHQQRQPDFARTIAQLDEEPDDDAPDATEVWPYDEDADEPAPPPDPEPPSWPEPEPNEGVDPQARSEPLWPEPTPEPEISTGYWRDLLSRLPEQPSSRLNDRGPSGRQVRRTPRRQRSERATDQGPDPP